jgi:uncharacterized paraquat-inducible protein A
MCYFVSFSSQTTRKKVALCNHFVSFVHFWSTLDAFVILYVGRRVQREGYVILLTAFRFID